MKMNKLFLILLFTTSILTAGGKKVLIEVFTNSHCVLCPAAHSTIDNYLQSGINKANIIPIYYHTSFPYPDDILNLHNTVDPSARNTFYGPFSSTPKALFDGQLQGTNYSSWGNVIDGIATQSPTIDIGLSGSISSGNANVVVKLKTASSGTFSNLSVYFLAVENVNYTGRNGISFHKNVVRLISPSSNGKSISLTTNQEVQITEQIKLNQLWNSSQLGFVVFIQNQQSKTIINSEFIPYNLLNATDIHDQNDNIPTESFLAQNYPNPFNPETIIGYQLASPGYVKLKVYDILGRELATLVDQWQLSGTYNVKFNSKSRNGEPLNSGIYFYRIDAGNFYETRKMILSR